MGEVSKATGDQRWSVLDADAAELTDLALETVIGGLVLIGPTVKPMRALAGLLDSPEVDAVEADSEKLIDWMTSPHEVVKLTRQASSIIRAGRTAVIYLDAHRAGSGRPISPDDCSFLCLRLGHIMLGLADTPAYIAVHGQPMADGLFQAVGEPSPDDVGAIAPSLNVLRLTANTMFPGTLVAVTPDNEAAAGLVQVLDFFEARRL